MDGSDGDDVFACLLDVWLAKAMCYGSLFGAFLVDEEVSCLDCFVVVHIYFCFDACKDNIFYGNDKGVSWTYCFSSWNIFSCWIMVWLSRSSWSCSSLFWLWILSIIR